MLSLQMLLLLKTLICLMMNGKLWQRISMIELNARGQASTFDIFISITVFVLLLGTSFVIWNDNFDSIRKESRFDNARFAAVNVLNNFVSTPGVPTNGENLVSVEMYGL